VRNIDRPEYHPVHEHAGDADGLRVELAVHDLVHLGDGELGALGEGRHEVAADAAELQVAEAVGAGGADQRDVHLEAVFEDVVDAVDGADLLALRDRRTDAGARVEGPDAGAAGPQALHEGALRHQLDLDLTGLDLLLGRGPGLARSGGERDDQAVHLAVLDEGVGPVVAGAERVRDDAEPPGALFAQRDGETGRKAVRHAEPGDRHARTVRDIGDRRRRRVVNFVDCH
jgi:hypothetical protein